MTSTFASRAFKTKPLALTSRERVNEVLHARLALKSNVLSHKNTLFPMLNAVLNYNDEGNHTKVSRDSWLQANERSYCFNFPFQPV